MDLERQVREVVACQIETLADVANESALESSSFAAW